MFPYNATNLIVVMVALAQLKGRPKMAHAMNHVEGSVRRAV